MSKLELAKYIIDTYPLAYEWEIGFLVANYTMTELFWLETVCKSQSYCDLGK